MSFLYCFLFSAISSVMFSFLMFSSTILLQVFYGLPTVLFVFALMETINGSRFYNRLTPEFFVFTSRKNKWIRFFVAVLVSISPVVLFFKSWSSLYKPTPKLCIKNLGSNSRGIHRDIRYFTNGAQINFCFKEN